MEDKIITILIAAITATITTLLVEPIKLWLQNRFSEKSLENKRTRKHDVELFNSLSKIFPEATLRATMYSIKVNAEFYYDYIPASNMYQLFIEQYEEGKFINEEINESHSKFLESLRNLEQDLFEDFTSSGKKYKPNEQNGMTKDQIKEKYKPLVEKVLSNYSEYRKLIKLNYQI